MTTHQMDDKTFEALANVLHEFGMCDLPERLKYYAQEARNPSRGLSREDAIAAGEELSDSWALVANWFNDQPDADGTIPIEEWAEIFGQAA
jgi:hypothetical protein